MTWVEFVNIAFGTLLLVLGGIIGFIINRLNKLETEAREDVSEIFQQIRELGTAQTDNKANLNDKFLQDLRTIERRMEERYVTKEWCGMKHGRGARDDN